MSAPWSVIVPKGNSELVIRFTKLAQDMGLPQVRTSEMLYLEFSAADQELPTVPVNWWESLTLTEPRTKIYANVEAQVYYSSGPDSAPSFAQKELTSTGQPRTVLSGGPVEVWRAPVAGSGWICVAVRSQDALWVRAEDMRETPQ